MASFEKMVEIPTSGLGAYIMDLSHRYGVTYIKTPDDELAVLITQLSDDDIEMDDVELLLIALERAGVVASENVVPLHINYLREKLDVRPF
jgi:hypothetical protein